MIARLLHADGWNMVQRGFNQFSKIIAEDSEVLPLQAPEIHKTKGQRDMEYNNRFNKKRAYAIQIEVEKGKVRNDTATHKTQE